MILSSIFFSSSSLFALALSLCAAPPRPVPLPAGGVDFVRIEHPPYLVEFACPQSANPDLPNLIYGNLGAGGPLTFETGTSSYLCNLADGKILTENGQEPTLTTAICRAVTTGYCVYILDGANMILDNGQTDVKCPNGLVMELSPEATKVPSLRCANSQLYAIVNGVDTPVGPIDTPKPIECKPAPPTTTTTTTTVKPDSTATANQLWNVNYYYNYGFGVHAYCADQSCINAIQSNGIGYDMNNGKGVMGRAIAESMINSIRASCPTGSGSLRNLGFTKSGNKYLHNLNGSGLKQGWVSVSNGACGASVGIKRWKSRYTDDMMYGTDLEWNTWYKGMVQEGGMVQFYMWA